MDDADFKRLLSEGRRVEESAMWSGQNQFEQAKIWRGLNYIIGIPATGLAAIAGAVALMTALGRAWAALAALAAASLSAVLTLLNLARRTDEAHTAANAYLAVQQDARVYCEIDLHKLEYEEARQALSELIARLQEVHKSAPLSSKRAYRRSRRNVDSGSQTYKVDQRASS
ncbi:hypothetical protein GCM10023088_36960 [Actinomadura verrucosospora]